MPIDDNAYLGDGVLGWERLIFQGDASGNEICGEGGCNIWQVWTVYRMHRLFWFC